MLLPLCRKSSSHHHHHQRAIIFSRTFSYSPERVDYSSQPRKLPCVGWGLAGGEVAGAMVEAADAENGKKLQQSGPASSGEEYTHGGVKKTKFEPKVPTRRLKKLSASAKSELPPGDAGLGCGSIPKELQRLLQQQGESDGPRGRDRPNQRTSKVAFGFGAGSSFLNRGVGKASHGGSSVGGSGGGSGPSEAVHNERLSRVVEKQEFMQADESFDLPKKGERKNLEVFDHEKYFPVTLPLRKPIAGVDTRRMDDEEFGEEEVEDEDNNEDGAEAAEELDLTDPKDEDTLFFFQFPKGLPLSLSPSGKEKKSSRSARLEDLGKGGAMGKLLVYESGAVKFKVGDVVFDALPGTECTFAQEVAAVNTTTKQCSFVGEVHQRVVLTPDIVDVLPDLTDLRTKR